MTIFDPYGGDSDDDEKRRKKRMAQHATLGSGNDAPNDRDRIAEKAMQCYLLEYYGSDYAEIAEWSYKMADAMLAERDRPPAAERDA